MIDWRVEITKDHWCRLVWNHETETIRVYWESGEPPPDLATPQGEKRVNEALNAFMDAILWEKLELLTEESRENVH